MVDAERHEGYDRTPEPAPRPGSDGEHVVQAWLGTAERAERFYDEQMLDHLNERMREFAQNQEMFFLATADRSGECDSSFRAGPAGFVRVLDERTLVYPEYRGNGVHASLGNIQENPHVGILFIDFVRARIGLHVNGSAEIVEDAVARVAHPDLPDDPMPGRRARVWVRVTVEEAYIHCAKHIPHLQKASRDAARAWGTDDYKRKGGDFFGAARDARRRAEHEAPSPAHPEPVLPPLIAPESPDYVLPAPVTPAPLVPPPVAPVPAALPPAAPPQPVRTASVPEPRGYVKRTPDPEPVPAERGTYGAAEHAESAEHAEIAESVNGPAEWQQEAQRVLAEAERRQRDDEPSSFAGWFA